MWVDGHVGKRRRQYSIARSRRSQLVVIVSVRKGEKGRRRALPCLQMVGFCLISRCLSLCVRVCVSLLEGSDGVSPISEHGIAFRVRLAFTRGVPECPAGLPVLVWFLRRFFRFFD